MSIVNCDALDLAFHNNSLFVLSFQELSSDTTSRDRGIWTVASVAMLEVDGSPGGLAWSKIQGIS